MSGEKKKRAEVELRYSTEFEDMGDEYYVSLWQHRPKRASSFDPPTSLVKTWRGPDLDVLYQWALDEARRHAEMEHRKDNPEPAFVQWTCVACGARCVKRHPGPEWLPGPPRTVEIVERGDCLACGQLDAMRLDHPEAKP